MQGLFALLKQKTLNGLGVGHMCPAFSESFENDTTAQGDSGLQGLGSVQLLAC